MRSGERRGSAIDVLFLLLLVALIIGAHLRQIDRNADENGAQTAAEVTLAVSSLYAPTVNCIAVGDALYRSDGTPLGTISGIEKAPSRVVLEENGSFLVGTPSDTQWDLRLRVQLKGSFHGSILFEGGRYAMPIGKPLSLYTDLAALRATVIAAKAQPRQGSNR